MTAWPAVLSRAGNRSPRTLTEHIFLWPPSGKQARLSHKTASKGRKVKNTGVSEVTVQPTPAAALRLVLILALTMLTACSLPRSGPNKSEIYEGAVERGGNAHII
jgi:hypothetical protein